MGAQLNRSAEKTLPSGIKLSPAYLIHPSYPFLAHANKKKCIPLIRALIDTTTAFAQKLVESVQEMMLRLTGVHIGCCPICGQGTMIVGVPIARAAFDTS